AGGQRAHRLHVTGEQDAGARVVAIAREARAGIGRGVEIHLHIPWDAHATELPLPVALRDGVVHEYDEAEVERLAPADDDLPVNEPVVHAIQHEAHGRTSITAIAAHPRAAAWRAASMGDSSSANAKSRSAGRFAPET